MEKAPTGERGDLAGEGEFSGGGRTVGEEEFHRRRVAVAAEGAEAASRMREAVDSNADFLTTDHTDEHG